MSTASTLAVVSAGAPDQIPLAYLGIGIVVFTIILVLLAVDTFKKDYSGIADGELPDDSDWLYLTPKERLGVQTQEDAELAKKLIAARKNATNEVLLETIVRKEFVATAPDGDLAHAANHACLHCILTEFEQAKESHNA